MPLYTDWGKAAQAWLKSRGLEQYVPAAHEQNRAAIHAQVAAGTLHAVWSDETPVAFFNLTEAGSVWWPADPSSALYLSGILVSPHAWGQGIGRSLLAWCADEAVRHGCHLLRLDCHAGNPWLCRYYEVQGFTLRGRIEQHSGYEGHLYERDVKHVQVPANGRTATLGDGDFDVAWSCHQTEEWEE